MRADAVIPYRRTVVDTNVLLSAALIPGGVPSRPVDAVLAHGTLVFSEPTFTELATRLWTPKFDRYLTMEKRQQLLHDFRAAALWVEIPPALATRSWSRDPDDDAFVRTAIAARVQRLVSGDADLLDLVAIDELCIVTPRQALEELAGGGH